MSGRESVLIAKLKDGIQEVIVFFRMLEGAKLSPVYDRKRRQLMDKLLDLQGDTRRAAPPSFEGDNEPSLPTSPERVDESRVSVISEGDGSESGERTLPYRSSKILDMRGKFEQSSSGRPNYYKTLDQLKRGSPSHKDTSGDKNVEEEQQEEKSPEKEEEAVEDEKEESFEIPEDVPDADLSQDKSQKKEKKDKKHRPAFFKKLLGPKRERSESGPSPMGSVENVNQTAKEDKENEGISPPEEETTADEPEEETFDDPDAPLVAILNRVSKRLGRTSLQQVQVVLQGTWVKITKLASKEKDRETTEINLAVSAAAQRDNLHFEICTTSKTYAFRTESEEQCMQWTSRLMEAIKSCTPDQPEEEELPSSEQQQQPAMPENPPQITVMAEDGGEVVPSVQDSNTLPGTPSYENIAFDKRRRKTMPEVSACLVRSNFYRKGTFGWDKVWCVLTHDNMLYISSSESSKKPQLVLPIDLQSKVEKKRGTEKYPHGLQLVVGGKREMIATDNEADFSKLLALLETATGFADIEELLSEDEGGDLYEDLPDTLDVVAPQVPSSPRPAQRPLPAPVEMDDDDGDIYEGMDDLDMPVQSLPPSIPATEPPKKYYSPSTSTSHQPSPSLPPRNSDAPPPTLPPRPPSMPTKPQEYEPARPSPGTLKKKVPPQPIDDELYDDVIAPAVDEEMYDDVVVPVMQEETYDDVVVPVNEPEESYEDVHVDGITDEFYEEMDPNDQGYVAMSKNKKPRDQPADEGNGSEFYTEMDTPPPRPPPPATSQQRASFSSSSPSSSPTSSLTRTAVTKSSNTPSKPAPPPSVVSKASQPLSSTTTTKQSSPVKAQSPLTTTKTSATTTTTSASKLAYNRTPGVGGPKKLQTTGKVATLSKMFQTDDKQQQPSAQKGSHCGSLLYKSSTKPSYVNEWCVLDGSTLQFFSASTDMRSHYKFSLRDAELSISQKSEMNSGQYGFHLAKSMVVHQFTTISKEEFDAWLMALAPVVQKCFPPDGSTYQAKEDHTASGEDEISFKRDDLVWVVSKDDSAGKWTGIVSTAEHKYAGLSGQFPSAKVRQVLAEDPYI